MDLPQQPCEEKQRRMLLELRAIPYLVGLLREIAERKFIDYLHGKELIDRLDVEVGYQFKSSSLARVAKVGVVPSILSSSRAAKVV